MPKPPYRGNQIIRQWKILQLLGSHPGLTAEEIGERTNTPKRTIYRDLECLWRAGFPIGYQRDGQFSYWLLTHEMRVGDPITPRAGRSLRDAVNVTPPRPKPSRLKPKRGRPRK
jgi:predicted DNA-binding transcriptional regulator YafY